MACIASERRLPTALGLCLGPLLLVSPARGDGGFFKEKMIAQREPVSAPGQKAVIIRDGDTHEILLLQTTYRGPSAGFAWVVPVPGLPERGDVFEANPEAFTMLDQQTRPEVRVRIEDPLGPRGFGPFSVRSKFTTVNAGLEDAESGSRPGVTVHDRMDVGDYDVSILSATGPGVLVDWLNRNGYSFPREAESIADDYVERGWKFVALRIRMQVQRQQTVLTDVSPLGIRFPAEELVYPLTISRVSAPEITTLSLIVVDDGGVDCTDLPTVTFPAETKTRKGVTYESMARELLSKHASEALLCEGRPRLDTWAGSPLARLELAKGVSAAAPESSRDFRRLTDEERRAAIQDFLEKHPDSKLRSLRDRVATRFWAELPRDAMVDLTFVRSSSPTFSLTVRKTAVLPTPRWLYFVGTSAARAAWTLVALALVLRLFWPRP